MSILQDKHLTYIKSLDDLISNLEEAAKYKVSGRVDAARMYLAKCRWLESKSTFAYHVLARDINTWYQDYFHFIKNNAIDNMTN